MAYPGRVTVARGILARLIAVCTVVAGFALLHAPQCVDGMSTAAHLAGSQSSAATAAVADLDLSTAHSVGHHPGTTASDPGGIVAPTAGEDPLSDRAAVMGCVALLLTMVGFVVLLRRPVIPLGRVVPQRCWRVASAPTPRPPSLTALCVLRT